jgi:acyl-homoserine lactone synthase
MLYWEISQYRPHLFSPRVASYSMGASMIHVISRTNRHLYEDVLEQHFLLRHRIFVEERKWEALRRPDGREIDNYDDDDTIYLLALEDRRVVGGHRLYPTTKPTMMGEVFPHLATVRGTPSDPAVWEWSRYFIVADRRDGNLNLQLMAAVQEFCLSQQIRQVSAIIEMWWLPRFQEAGFVVTPLGLPAIVENAWTMAALIEIQQSTLDVMAERTGQSSVLFHRGPQLDAIARARLCMTAADARERAS